MNIAIKERDILDYVSRSSCYDPVEKCIDPSLYETYDTFILRMKDQEYIYQDKDYSTFYNEVIKLKKNYIQMHPSEVRRLVEEIKEIAPKTVKL